MADDMNAHNDTENLIHAIAMLEAKVGDLVTVLDQHGAAMAENTAALNRNSEAHGG